MTQYWVIDRPRAEAWLRGLTQKQEVLVPAARSGVWAFLPLEAGLAIGWDGANPLLPAKGAFFPQTDPLFRFRREEGKLNIEPVAEAVRERVLFGIRPCDARSLALLDKVFGGPFADSQYQARRAATLLVAWACDHPRPTCFCQSVGVDPTTAPEADVMFAPLPRESRPAQGSEQAPHQREPGSEMQYLVWAQTQRGQSWLESGMDYLDRAQAGQVEAWQETAAGMANAHPLELDMEGVTDRLRQRFDDSMWEELSARCLGCGICTFVCPTCHCFDIADWQRGQEGLRFKCWDSCSFRDFTLMAGGHNPRPTKKERIRQRFLHKLLYFVDRYGAVACVGCGRCVEQCPVHLDITEVILRVKGGEWANV